MEMFVKKLLKQGLKEVSAKLLELNLKVNLDKFPSNCEEENHANKKNSTHKNIEQLQIVQALAGLGRIVKS